MPDPAPSITYGSFVNGTAANADEVNQNFDDLVNWLTTYAIRRDGTTAMTGQLTLPSATDPSTDNQAAKYKQVKPFGCILGRTNDFNVANDTFVPITWNTEYRDDGGFWSSGTDAIVPAGGDGIYVIHAVNDFASNGTNRREIFLSVNPDTVPRALGHETIPDPGGVDQMISITRFTHLVAGDKIRTEVYQASGVTLVSYAQTELSPLFCMYRIAVL